MKKINKFFALMLAIIIVVSFTACKKSDNSNINMDENLALEYSKKHTQMLIDGDYKGVVNNLSKAVKMSVDENALKQGWESLAVNAGECHGIYSSNNVDFDGGFSTETIVKFENTALRVTLTYDTIGEIIGIFISPTQIEMKLEENDDFVETYIAVGDYELDGVLTLPKGVSEYPLVIMVQGSGSSDYDETIGAAQNKPFKQISDALASQGIATLRYTKRFYQKPTLANANMDVYNEYLNDVYWLIDYAHKNITQDIYVLGHSLGGMSTPRIAQDKQFVKGIIMLAGTSRGLEDVLYDQNVKVIQAMDTTSTQKKFMIATADKYLQQVKGLQEGDTIAPFGINAEYWISLKSLDTENILNKLEIPVLIMQGDKDFQVYVDKDFNKMKQDLKGKSNVTFKLYQGLNHLFMPQVLQGDAVDISEYDTENYIPSDVTNDIAQWIKKVN